MFLVAVLAAASNFCIDLVLSGYFVTATETSIEQQQRQRQAQHHGNSMAYL